MSNLRSFPPGAGRPFTLWLDPARWPVPLLKLPSRAFTLWQDPAVWPKRTLQLPGLATTLWLDPARWPVSRLVLPGLGYTLWLNPETWPRPQEFSMPLPPPVMPIIISQNKAFTLWTRPNHVIPIPMRNGLTAAALAATSGTAPPVTVPPAVPLPPAPASPPAAESAPVPFAHRLLPIAAAFAAILGVSTLMNVAESKKSEMNSAEVADMHQQIDLASKGMIDMKVSQEKAAVDFKEKAAQIEAKSMVLKEENDRLVTKLAQIESGTQQAETKLAAQTALAAQLSVELDRAKLAAATADTKAQGAVVAATEEASTVKREAAAEVVKLRETLARMAAEKAAALREAATAAQEKAELQKALDALRKLAP